MTKNIFMAIALCFPSFATATDSVSINRTLTFELFAGVEVLEEVVELNADSAKYIRSILPTGPFNKQAGNEQICYNGNVGTAVQLLSELVFNNYENKVENRGDIISIGTRIPGAGGYNYYNLYNCSNLPQ